MTEEIIVTGGRIKSTALFNRLTGEWVTTTSIPLAESQHNPEYYIAREVDYYFGENGDIIEGKLDIDKFGNVTDNFKVVPYAEQKSVITEAQMNTLAAQKITNRYPITTQLNLVVACVNRLGEEHGLSDSPEFEALNEMVEYINYCVQVNKTKKEHYRDDPDINYKSDEDIANELSRRMEGGIHEELGPRTINGGRIFS